MHQSLQWPRQNFNQGLHSHKTPHISPSGASYEVSIVSILEKTVRYIMTPHCISFCPQNSDRTLQDPQHDQLVTVCTACALPLFAKLSYDSATRWRSYQPVEECILGQAVEDSIELLFERVEKYHGEVLVRRALGYLTAAKSGLRYEVLFCCIIMDFCDTSTYKWYLIV